MSLLAELPAGGLTRTHGPLRMDYLLDENNNPIPDPEVPEPTLEELGFTLDDPDAEPEG